jgi:hypothetical protein
LEQLAEDLRNRTGRSILHELNDQELEELVDFIAKQVGSNAPITEKDRWTIWIAKKP